jgi:hypothetical protein
MGMNNFSRKQVKKEEKDEILGRALARAIKENAKADECLSDEVLSSFVDGTLNEQERDAVVGHLAHCDKCYEVVSLAREMVEEEKEEKASNRRWFYAPVAAVAAAILIIVFKFVMQIPVPYSPPSSAQMAVALAKNTDAKSLSNSIKDEQLVSFGFGSGISLEKISFRSGVCLTDLDISLMAEDKPKSLQVIKGMISTLQSVEGSAVVISFYKDISGEIEENVSPKEFFGKSEKIEQFFKNKEVLLYLKFGGWTEGGRIAALTKNREFFDIKSSQYFIEKLEGKELPQGVFKAIEEIKGILVRNEFADGDFNHLKRAFTEIVEMM